MFAIILMLIVVVICVPLAMMTINPAGVGLMMLGIFGVATLFFAGGLWWSREQTNKPDAGQGDAARDDKSGSQA